MRSHVVLAVEVPVCKHYVTPDSSQLLTGVLQFVKRGRVCFLCCGLCTYSWPLTILTSARLGYSKGMKVVMIIMETYSLVSGPNHGDACYFLYVRCC